MINSVTLVGRLTADPELRHTSSGNAVGNFSVACERSFKNNSGEKEVDFVPVVVWRGLAENCGNYLAKGKLVAVHGRLQIRKYEDRDGNKRTIAEVVGDDVQFLTPKGDAGGNNSVAGDEFGFGADTAPPDDIPF